MATCKVGYIYLSANSSHSPAGGCEVVAFGTGNVNTKESASSSGRIVHDSHAVVTARRSLMRLVRNNVISFGYSTVSINWNVKTCFFFFFFFQITFNTSSFRFITYHTSPIYQDLHQFKHLQIPTRLCSMMYIEMKHWNSSIQMSKNDFRCGYISWCFVKQFLNALRSHFTCLVKSLLTSLKYEFPVKPIWFWYDVCVFQHVLSRSLVFSKNLRFNTHFFL